MTVVACGVSGQVQYSADGQNPWTAATTPTSNQLNAVATNGAGEWIVCGVSSTVIHSTDDGVTWTSRTASGSWYSAAYGNGTWVIVGLTGAIKSSTDGITWTTRTSAYGTDNLYHVRWDSTNSQFVIGGNWTRVQTSSDGITWTGKGQIVSGAPTVRIADGVVWDNSATNYIGVTDGINFTLSLRIYTTGAAMSAWSLRYTVAGRYGINNAIETSSGTTCVGDGHGQIHSSTDATTWAQVSGYPLSVSTLFRVGGIAHTGSLWVFVHSFGQIITSADLVSFNTETSAFSVNNIYGVAASVGGVAAQTYTYETSAITYTLTLTGAADALSDLALPMATARATFSNQRLSTFQAVVPTTTYYDDIVARPNGELVVNATRELSDGTTGPSVELWRFPYIAVTKTVGADTGQLELVTENDIAYTAGNTVELRNTERRPERGRIVVRSDIDFYARPADTANIFDSSIENFEIGKVEYTLSPDNSYMVVSEYIDDDGAA